MRRCQGTQRSVTCTCSSRSEATPNYWLVGKAMPPNNELSSIMFDLPELDINIDMCRGSSSSNGGSSPDHNKDSSTITFCEVAQKQSQITHSPVSISNANLLDTHATVGDISTIPPPPHHASSHNYTEGKVSVTRSARKRRIKRGCLSSSGSEEYKSFDVSYRIYRPELLRSSSAIPLLVLHGGP